MKIEFGVVMLLLVTGVSLQEHAVKGRSALYRLTEKYEEIDERLSTHIEQADKRARDQEAENTASTAKLAELGEHISNLEDKVKEVEDKLKDGSFVGCYEDNENRELPNAQMESYDMINSICVSHCFDKGYKYAGTQYASYCFCGDTLPSKKMPDTDCNMACKGNADQFCGGDWRNSVHLTGI